MRKIYASLFLFVLLIAIAMALIEESFQATPTSPSSVTEASWRGQVVRIGGAGLNQTFTVAKVQLWFNVTDLGNYTVLIQNNTGPAQQPNGQNVSRGSITFATLGNLTTELKPYNITLTSAPLYFGNNYTIIIFNNKSSGSDNGPWSIAQPNALYRGGNLTSSNDAGATWTNTSNDFVFNLYSADSTSAQQVFPADNSLIINSSFLLNVSVIPSNIILSNITFNIWNSSGVWNSTFYSNGASSLTHNVSNIPSGVYSWNVYGCTLVQGCFVAPTNYTFTYGLFVNSQAYNITTTETYTEAFQVNISVPSGRNINLAYLNYSGSLYNTSIDSYGDNRIIRSSIIIPTVSSTTNVSFNWIINLGTPAFNYTTSQLNQTVNNIGLDNCAVNSIRLINYTIRDEDSRNVLASYENISANVYVQVTGDPTGEVFIYYANSSTSNPIGVCIANNSLVTGNTYILDSTISFSATNYVQEYYYIENHTFNSANIPVQVTLYDLLITRSQEFLVKFRDDFFTPVEGAIITLSREYLSLGQYLTVENAKTDNDGNTILHFVLNDEIYTITVVKDGILLATFENQRAFCTNLVTGDCQITLDQPGSTTSTQDFTTNLGVSYVPYYNDTSKTFTVSFVSLDNSVKTILLNITKYDNYLNETICTNSLTSSSGSMSCTIPTAYYNSTALANIYVDGELLSSSIFSVSISNSDLQTSARYILAFFLLLTLPLLAFTDGVMMLVLFLIGLITASFLFLIDLGSLFGPTSAVIFVIVASAILIIKSRRTGQ